jgi:hypothetical protein|tara:strand:- start:2 stop:232 length:231 start_codon:yes stop_codon:yes gene_type:complete
MEIYFDNTAILTNTRSEVAIEAEVDNFKEGEKFDAFLATNKIVMRWTGKIFVGNAHGMEFTSPGPSSHRVNKRRNF